MKCLKCHHSVKKSHLNQHKRGCVPNKEDIHYLTMSKIQHHGEQSKRYKRAHKKKMKGVKK